MEKHKTKKYIKINKRNKNSFLLFLEEKLKLAIIINIEIHIDRIISTILRLSIQRLLEQKWIEENANNMYLYLYVMVRISKNTIIGQDKNKDRKIKNEIDINKVNI